MRHEDIWAGIDALAAVNQLSPSGLARRAGLDATVFNPSKRVGQDGRPRWPSTESVARALEAVDATLGDLAALISGSPVQLYVPTIGFAEAGLDGFFDAGGLPTGPGWSQVKLATASTDTIYALEVSGMSMMPTFRPGDKIVVSPKAEIHPGDRVVIRTGAGEVMAKELVSDDGDVLQLRSLNPAFSPRTLASHAISWLARIQWVSQ
ncbi:MAG: helix-turn-helix transcriptional regulator [Pseudomonadota bacterium]